MKIFRIDTNMWLLSAAILSFVASIGHLVVGTPELMHPVYSSNTPEISKGIVEVMWNGIALLCVVAGSILLRAAIKPQAAVDLSLAIILMFLGLTGLFIASGLARFGDVNSLPQWHFFVIIPILVMVGLRNRSAKSA